MPESSREVSSLKRRATARPQHLTPEHISDIERLLQQVGANGEIQLVVEHGVVAAINGFEIDPIRHIDL